MKNFCLLLLLFIALPALYAQPYWQQQTNYTIDVSLNDKDKTLDGFERLVYTNNSPDTLRFIWFHLWPNAYKNDRTAFSDQLLENGSTDFYFSGKEQRGYINRLAFKADGQPAKTEDHPQHIDIAKLILPKPLPPKAQVIITTPFHVKLPFAFSRSGYNGQWFQLAQWYPKPAVYDKQGWHPMPYLNQGEFYSEFGSFDVRITVPKDYAVAATGALQNEEEKAWLKTRADYKRPAIVRATLPAGKRPNRTTVPVVKAPTETKTLRFQQDKVHDFAWFASKHFVVQSDTLQLTSDRTITVSSFYTPEQRKAWQNSVQYAKDAVRFYSAEVGEYPYTTVTVVQGPESFAGGMEYPTITVVSPENDPTLLDGVIAHEVGHNWFYGMLATNERQHPWMDEGLNSFYEGKYRQGKYGPQGREAQLLLQRKAVNKTDQPATTPSEEFSELNYGLAAYLKAAEWLKGLEQKLGADAFRQMMQQYFTEWKFRHPQPEDFKAIVAQRLGNETEKYFAALHSTGVLPGTEGRGTAVVFPLKKNAIKNYTTAPAKNAILLSPAVGFNSYDKLMLGGLVSNYGSPVARLNFLAVPLYATGSGSFVGLSRLNYAITSNGAVRKADVFVNASSFTASSFQDEDGRKHNMRFLKLVPGFRLTFKERSPRSTVRKFVQWKTYLLREESLDVSLDSVITPTDTTVKYRYSTPATDRYLNQLQLGFENGRALYPFSVKLMAEQAQDFVRTTLTATYFFNYPKDGGLKVRFFAGKFSYLGGKTVQKQFANDRYHLNMTGANGYEDYTYSDYFLGRNKFDGLASQQIMIRDGAFKVRTDLLASKIGKTDNWLMAANLETTIPEFPLRLFADIGTHAEAWDRNADTDRFLFDAGLQLPLFSETVNIYVPLFYSKVYSTYFKSTIPDNRFWKTISFSVNLYNKQFRRLNHELEF